jgi:hypothetical protein
MSGSFVLSYSRSDKLEAYVFVCLDTTSLFLIIIVVTTKSNKTTIHDHLPVKPNKKARIETFCYISFGGWSSIWYRAKASPDVKVRVLLNFLEVKQSLCDRQPIPLINY